MQSIRFLCLLFAAATLTNASPGPHIAATTLAPWELAMPALALNTTPPAPAITSSPEESLIPEELRLLRPRQNVCAVSYAQCAGAPSLCCPVTANCEADAEGMVGCCPFGAACTGVVNTASATAPASSAASSAVTTTAAASSTAAGVGVNGATVTASGFISGETIFAASAPERWRRRGNSMLGAIGAGIAALLAI